MNGIQDMLVNTNMMSHKVLYLECIILIIQFCLLFSIDFQHFLIYFLKLYYVLDMARPRAEIIVKEGNVCLTREDFWTLGLVWKAM